MTNDQAIVIAATNLLNKTVRVSTTQFSENPLYNDVTIGSLDEALQTAREMMAKQVEHSRNMMINAGNVYVTTNPNVWPKIR